MSPPTSNHREDDGEIRGWIAEAGDLRVEPRPEHVEQVRHLLLERVLRLPEAVIPPEERETPLWLGLVRLVAAACALAAALFAAVHLATRPADAWASVAQALQNRPWIHIVATGSDGLRQESWISPRFEILATKRDRGDEPWGAEYHDLKTDVKTEYIADEDTIYRLPEHEDLQRHRGQELEVFRQLLRGEDFKSSPYPETEIVEQSKREVIERGKTWKVYDLTIRGTSGRKSQARIIIRVDPTTGLPQTWDVEADDGTLHQTFDYPAVGPADILALGVPATAKRVDRVPGAELDQVLNGLKIGRNRFDDYCGYVWFSPNVKRVWHKGNRWRVEDVNLRMPTRATLVEFDRPPDDADLAWWKRRERDFVFDPQAICDGQTIWYYHYKPQAIVPDQPFSLTRESVSSQGVYGTPDDPNMPWPHLSPEQVGHPDIGVPDPSWAFFLDPKPKDGPPNTVRLSARDVTFNDPNRPDVYRFWVDPEKQYLALRAESSVFADGPRSPRTGRSTKIAYVETKILTELARSPSGFWYPTRVLRKTSNSRSDHVTRFALDFDTPIPDALFQPIK